MSDALAAKGLILSESRILRLFSFFLFYFGQGLPVGLTVIALPVWIAANGGSSTDVATIVAVAYLPWSYKFIIAAFMDRYSYLAMGRRRAWLIFAQVLMSAGFVAAAIMAPGPEDVNALIVVTMLVMTGAATQDVAVDGLAVDVLPEKEQGTASGFMFGGQAFGSAAAAAASGFGLQYLGSFTTFMLFIPVLLIPTVYAVIILENPGERRFSWSKGQASAKVLAAHTGEWKGMIMITLRSLFRGSSLWFILSQSFGRIAGGMTTPMWPLLATTFLLMETSEYTNMISTVDLAMAFGGLIVGSWLTLKLGAKWATVAVIGGFISLIIFLLLGKDLWTQMPIFIAMSVFFSLFTLLSSICSNPLRMQLSDKRVGATQFTIYNSLANLPVSLGAMLFAWMGGVEDLTRTLTATLVIFSLAGVCYALLRMPKVVDPEDDVLAGDSPTHVQ